MMKVKDECDWIGYMVVKFGMTTNHIRNALLLSTGGEKSEGQIILGHTHTHTPCDDSND